MADPFIGMKTIGRDRRARGAERSYSLISPVLAGLALALIIGENELARDVAALKPLRLEAGQSECPMTELPGRIEAALKGTDLQE